jgi:hypothetical protein
MLRHGCRRLAGGDQQRFRSQARLRPCQCLRDHAFLSREQRVDFDAKKRLVGFYEVLDLSERCA